MIRSHRSGSAGTFYKPEHLNDLADRFLAARDRLARTDRADRDYAGAYNDHAGTLANMARALYLGQTYLDRGGYRIAHHGPDDVRVYPLLNKQGKRLIVDNPHRGVPGPHIVKESQG